MENIQVGQSTSASGLPMKHQCMGPCGFLENDGPSPLEEMWTAARASCRDHIDPKP